MSDYHSELTRAMALVSRQPRALFIGQAVGCAGTTMSSTFADVPADQRIEFPVAEELQLSYCTGLALMGFLPVAVFPRFNFMMRCMDALVNHLDRLPIYSGGGYKPKVIIRVAVPSTHPFNPQSQHDDDFTLPFKAMLRTVKVWTLTSAEMIAPLYQEAADRDGSTILVEYTDLYRDARATEVK